MWHIVLNLKLAYIARDTLKYFATLAEYLARNGQVRTDFQTGLPLARTVACNNWQNHTSGIHTKLFRALLLIIP